MGREQQTTLSNARSNATDQTDSADMGANTRDENESAVTMIDKKRIRFSLPIDLLVTVYNAKETNETFDACIERYVKLGMQIEGSL